MRLLALSFLILFLLLFPPASLFLFLMLFPPASSERTLFLFIDRTSCVGDDE